MTTASSASAPGRRADWFVAAATTRLLAAAWGGLLLLRLLLLGSGTLVDYDERRYFQSFEALRAAAHGNWSACAYALSMVDARPVDALWRCVPAAGQLLLARYAGWDTAENRAILDGRHTLEEVAARGRSLQPQPRSGRQEYLESLLNRYV